MDNDYATDCIPAMTIALVPNRALRHNRGEDHQMGKQAQAEDAEQAWGSTLAALAAALNAASNNGLLDELEARGAGRDGVRDLCEEIDDWLVEVEDPYHQWDVMS